MSLSSDLGAYQGQTWLNNGGIFLIIPVETSRQIITHPLVWRVLILHIMSAQLTRLSLFASQNYLKQKVASRASRVLPNTARREEFGTSAHSEQKPFQGNPLFPFLWEPRAIFLQPPLGKVACYATFMGFRNLVKWLSGRACMFLFPFTLFFIRW